jgi:type II secretory pathway pseudopilin PulG
VSGARQAMTVIELMVVVSVATLLATLATTASLPALRKGRINQAVTQVRDVCDAARRLARLGARTPAAAASYYGVRLQARADGVTAAVTWGGDAMPGVPAVDLGRIVEVTVDGVPLRGQVEWAYAYGTGFPIDPVSRAVRAVGTGPGSVPEALELRARGIGHPCVAVAVYEIGLLNAQDL